MGALTPGHWLAILAALFVAFLACVVLVRVLRWLALAAPVWLAALALLLFLMAR